MTLSSFAAYIKQLWRNKPDTSTPVTAERLAHMEEGIKGNSDAIEEIAAAVVSQIINDPDKIASMAAVYAVNQKVATLDGKVGDTAQLPDGATDVVTAIAKQNSDLLNISTDQNYIAINEGFVASGHFQVCLINKAYISVSINVKTTKSSTDWIFNLKDRYRPQYKFQFSYYLGEKEYSGHIDEAGNVFFSTLNTTDILSCSLCFPIA